MEVRRPNTEGDDALEPRQSIPGGKDGSPEDRVKALVYCEFHPQTGPGVALTYPNPLPSTVPPLELEYLIPKRALCGRLISFRNVVGFPVVIDSPHYERNAFVFNFAIIGESNAALKRMVANIASRLKYLEQSACFLSTQKGRLKIFMSELYEDLNRHGECSLSVDGVVVVNLKMMPTPPQTLPTTIKDYEVPIFIKGPVSKSFIKWDDTIAKVIRHINGVDCVCRIVELSNVDSRLVKAVIHHFLYSGDLKLVDIFQFSNVYVTTKAYHDFKPRDQRWQLLGALRYGLTVSDWARQQESHIKDTRALIVYGLINGIIRRVFEVAITESREQYSDSLCVEYGISKRELKEQCGPKWKMVFR